MKKKIFLANYHKMKYGNSSAYMETPVEHGHQLQGCWTKIALTGT